MTGSDVTVPLVLKHIWSRLASPVKNRLQSVFSCGLTPQKLAMTICFGAALGTMPLLWGTTLICILLAYLFRLNHLALQSVNYLLYPVQLMLLLPFYKIGSWLFPWGPPVSHEIFSSLIHNPARSSVHILGWITLKSLAAWTVTALPAALLIYGIQRAAASRK